MNVEVNRTLAQANIYVYLYQIPRHSYWELLDFHSTVYAVCAEWMAPREGSNGRVRIGGDSFQESPPHLSRGYGYGCKTLPRLINASILALAV